MRLGSAAQDRGAAPAPAPSEFAPGAYQMPVGNGPLRANVYFVRAGAESGAGVRSAAPAAWVLIDTAVPGSGPEIRAAAESLFGGGAAPATILVTHAHPDHIGSAAELARVWQCPVYLHAEDVRMVGGDIGHFWRHSFTLDRWLMLPILRAAGKRHIQTIMARGGLREFALPLQGAAAPQGGGAYAPPDSRPAMPVPGLPDWQAIPTPGHTPGHVAFFRGQDRVLIAGDAVVTVVDPLSALLGKHAVLSQPPWYFTWNRREARLSIARLAELEPLVIAGGHGRPQVGSAVAAKLHELARN
jgi:glyoxylase-like metal-dependent hydrolase (beta-lactamase superfamily II)